MYAQIRLPDNCDFAVGIFESFLRHENEFDECENVEMWK